MARVGLPATGTFSYNGQAFDGALRVEFNQERIRDEADRTVVSVATTIDVDFYAQATDIAAIRANLAEDGKVLIFANKGFGAAINTDNKPDLKWGPKTGPLKVVDVGGSQIMHCHWSVTTFLAECPDAVTSGIIAMNYEMSFRIDQYGLTTRIINGYWQIAQTRGAGNRIAASADNFRLQMGIQTIKGYKRDQDYRNSKDRSRVDFTITDTPIPSRIPYPKTVIDINGTHSFTWSVGKAAQPRHILSVEMVPVSSSQNRGKVAVLTFLSILQAKFKYFAGLPVGANDAGGNEFFLEEINIEESLFGLPVRCAAVWTQFLKPDKVISNILSVTGQFIDIGTDWTSWQSVVSQQVFGPYGAVQYATPLDIPKLEDPAALDRIVDPCNPLVPNVPADDLPPPKKADPGPSLGKQSPPARQTSYLHFRNWTETERNTGVGRLKYSQLPGNDVTSGYANWDPTDANGMTFPVSSGANDVIYYAGRSSYTVEYCGEAMRAGYPVPRPNLASIGVQGASEQLGRFNHAQVGTYFGVPVYAASWRIRYLIPGSPGNLQTPPTQTS